MCRKVGSRRRHRAESRLADPPMPSVSTGGCSLTHHTLSVEALHRQVDFPPDIPAPLGLGGHNYGFCR